MHCEWKAAVGLSVLDVPYLQAQSVRGRNQQSFGMPSLPLAGVEIDQAEAEMFSNPGNGHVTVCY